MHLVFKPPKKPSTKRYLQTEQSVSKNYSKRIKESVETSHTNRQIFTQHLSTAILNKYSKEHNQYCHTNMFMASVLRIRHHTNKYVTLNQWMIQSDRSYFIFLHLHTILSWLKTFSLHLYFWVYHFGLFAVMIACFVFCFVFLSNPITLYLALCQILPSLIVYNITCIRFFLACNQTRKFPSPLPPPPFIYLHIIWPESHIPNLNLSKSDGQKQRPEALVVWSGRTQMPL